MGNAEINFDDMDIQDVRFYQIENTCEHPYHPGLSIIQSGGHQFTSPLAPSKIQNILEL